MQGRVGARIPQAIITVLRRGDFMGKPFFPQEFVEKYSELLGSESGEFFSACSLKIRKSIWLNSLMARPSMIARDLMKIGWALRPLFHENAYSLEGVQHPGASDEFRQGLFNLQEKAAMLPAIVLKPDGEDLVLDAAAAPGNKTLQLSCLMGGRGKIIAVDKSVQRVKSLRFNVKKFGMANVLAQQSDLLASKKAGLFDRVLLDAPCSSEGLVRKDFGALRGWSEELVLQKSMMQKGMISAAFRLLKAGGTLVYSTCSLAPEEDEEVVAFLLNAEDAYLEGIKVEGFRTRSGLSEYNGKGYGKELGKCTRIYPQDNDTQQFFIAKIRKL